MSEKRGIIFAVFFAAATLSADEVSEIRAMTKEKVDLVIQTLKDTSLSKKEKNNKKVPLSSKQKR